MDDASASFGPTPGTPVANFIAAVERNENFGEAFAKSWLRAPWSRYTDNTISVLAFSREQIQQKVGKLMKSHGVMLVTDRETDRRARAWMEQRGK